MEIERLTKPSGVISALANQPKNLTAEDLKTKFDAVPDYILDFINKTLIPAIENGTPTKLSDLQDDYQVNNAANSKWSEFASCDNDGNEIAKTYATLKYVSEEIAKLVDSSPEALNTLNELASALGNDENHTATMMDIIGKKADKASVPAKLSDLEDDSVEHMIDKAYRADIANIAGRAYNAERDYSGNTFEKYYAAKEDVDKKVDKEDGKGLSTNDYTSKEKEKLAGIAEGAQANVQADWNENDETADSYIKNKPDINDTTIPLYTPSLTTLVTEGAVATFVSDYFLLKKDAPTKLSDLEDDTTSEKAIGYAVEAGFAFISAEAHNSQEANKAIMDIEDNIIHETYATKEELTAAIGEALEGDY